LILLIDLLFLSSILITINFSFFHRAVDCLLMIVIKCMSRYLCINNAPKIPLFIPERTCPCTSPESARALHRDGWHSDSRLLKTYWRLVVVSLGTWMSGQASRFVVKMQPIYQNVRWSRICYNLNMMQTTQSQNCVS
jgi:hypothetical protein